MRVVLVAASLHGVPALVESQLQVGLQFEESALERVDVDPGTLRLGLLAARLSRGGLGDVLTTYMTSTLCGVTPKLRFRKGGCVNFDLI